MTNRELAERLVAAVMSKHDGVEVPAEWPTAVDAVLGVLHETGHCFCRVAVCESGITDFQVMDDDAERMQREAQQRVKENQADLFSGEAR